ncbi:MAG: hypothetical protein PHS93_02365 [Candidatus Omnitrophica bacterium]|nr:hypothetical protein [Candidatus Omnitrophota bacterium]MDD5351996.1 hypothetical protein [Candidatus Omnitrophota bacterium]MDD5551050.1 hypothetical protein [Candidatus Omnitrophota bacterium]
MKRKHLHKFDAGFVFMEIIFTAVIIFILCYLSLKIYLKKPSMDKPAQEIFSQAGINTTSQKTILDTTKERINVLNKQILGQEKQLEDIAK